MSYQVLARKWRPRSFAELVGQEHVVRPLVNALERNRLHHAFLFTGTRGVGKTTIARIIAKSLNCETGVTATPCGSCSACTEVDEGRFVDLIEVDAASRTKVDDTRELLDNVQYAPARGRYKVYLIDEVHMLSGHSFNALLKTLEEPPPHVKFLLATTDPQKLPITVLSRCLQFSLKRLSPEQIAQQLRAILAAENIPCEDAALALLVRGADGSMRDGLSLLDQAIAFGAGALVEADVRAMLGTVDQDTVHRCLDALIASDALSLIGALAGAVEHGTDPEALLDELLRALHELALAQVDATLTLDERLRAQAQRLRAEDIQLYYQIGVLGRRDLPYAPDPRSGVEMILLRMLTFRPADVSGATPVRGTSDGAARVAPGTASPAATLAPPAATKAVAANPAPAAETKPVAAPMAAIGVADWAGVVSRLKLDGFVRELAHNTVLESFDNGQLRLILDESCARLLNKERETELKQALEAHFAAALRLSIRIAKPAAETPARERVRVQDERQQQAVRAIEDDPTVRALQDRFGARVNPTTIRPKVQS